MGLGGAILRAIKKPPVVPVGVLICSTFLAGKALKAWSDKRRRSKQPPRLSPPPPPLPTDLPASLPGTPRVESNSSPASEVPTQNPGAGNSDSSGRTIERSFVSRQFVTELRGRTVSFAEVSAAIRRRRAERQREVHRDKENRPPLFGGRDFVFRGVDGAGIRALAANLGGAWRNESWRMFGGGRWRCSSEARDGIGEADTRRAEWTALYR